MKALSFNDITLVPAPFCEISSRADVDPSNILAGDFLKLPVIASNMDSVYSPKLARTLRELGGMACLHRFETIEENVKHFIESKRSSWVSIGVGEYELSRAKTLVSHGASVVLIDLANGACRQSVDQFLKVKDLGCKVVVGNFGTYEQINEFVNRAGGHKPDAIKISIGSGAACITRQVAGVGLPSIETILSCRKTDIPMIFDGGITNSGDLAKALALGCSAVMIGKLFSATYESISSGNLAHLNSIVERKYRGSASAASYEAQGKTAKWRAPEGDEMIVTVDRSIEVVYNQLEGGLRSSMTYLNAKNLTEFQENANFVEVSQNSKVESQAHGKKSL